MCGSQYAKLNLYSVTSRKLTRQLIIIFDTDMNRTKLFRLKCYDYHTTVHDNMLIFCQSIDILVEFCLLKITTELRGVHAGRSHALENCLISLGPVLQCFDAVGWAAGRASGL